MLKVFLRMLCPKHCPVYHNSWGSEATMAQQNPCWINLQSLLEFSVLCVLLRTSSANSVSAVELKVFSCCIIIVSSLVRNICGVIWRGTSLCRYSSTLYSAALRRTLKCLKSMTDFTHHCKPTAHSTTAVL